MPGSEAKVSGLAWSHASVVGVQAMDDQHGILMDTVNELRVQLLRGGNRDQIGAMLDRLVEFTEMHFACEESLLERYGYPHLSEHRAEHMRLVQEIRGAVEHSAHAQASDLQPLVTFLRSWYIDHVENADHQYGEWLNGHGIY